MADPVRRRILELMAGGERTAGDITRDVVDEFNISQPAVSQHLRVLRENGFAATRADGPRRYYAVDPAGLAEIITWATRVQAEWTQRLHALGEELGRR